MMKVGSKFNRRVALALSAAVAVGSVFTMPVNGDKLKFSAEVLEEIGKVEGALVDFADFLEDNQESKELFETYLSKLYSGEIQEVGVKTNVACTPQSASLFAEDMFSVSAGMNTVMNTTNSTLNWNASHFEYDLISGFNVRITGLTPTGRTYLSSVNGVLQIPPTLKNGNTTFTVTAIGDFAFGYLFNPLLGRLNSVDIPSTVRVVGGGAFMGSSFLNSVTFRATIAPTFSTNTFDSTYVSKINVPFGAIESYESSLAGGFDYESSCLSGHGKSCKCRFRVGDVNGSTNGAITIDDANEILRFVIGLSSSITSSMDSRRAALIVSTNTPQAGDATEIQKYLIGQNSVLTGLYGPL